MKQNQDLLYSLTHFDLSENPLGPESQGPLVFLKEPQTVTTLNLSKCSLNFELVSGRKGLVYWGVRDMLILLDPTLASVSHSS